MGSIIYERLHINFMRITTQFMKFNIICDFREALSLKKILHLHEALIQSSILLLYLLFILQWHCPELTYEVLYFIFLLRLPVSSTSPTSRTSLERPVFSRASCSSTVRNLHTDRRNTGRKPYFKNISICMYVSKSLGAHSRTLK